MDVPVRPPRTPRRRRVAQAGVQDGARAVDRDTLEPIVGPNGQGPVSLSRFETPSRHGRYAGSANHVPKVDAIDDKVAFRSEPAPSNSTTATDEPLADDPVPWTPPEDGILKGPPLTKPLAGDSLGLILLRSLRQHGARPALVDAVTGDSMHHQELLRESVCLARALRILLQDVKDEEVEGHGEARHDKAAGKAEADEKSADKSSENETTDKTQDDKRQKSTVLGVFVENRKELLPSLIANLLLGIPVTMLNPLSNTGELVRAWTETRPSVSLCSWSTLPAVLEASRSLPSLRHIVVFPGGGANGDEDDITEAVGLVDVPWTLHVIVYSNLLQRVTEDDVNLDSDVALAKSLGAVARMVTTLDHTAYLLQCGPGGRFARLTHRNLIYTVQLLQEPEAAGYGWTPDDVLLLGAPLSHAFGLGLCLGALALGLKVVVMPYFREQLFLSAVQVHKVSQLVLVPRQAALLAHSPLLEDAVIVAGLRGVRRGLRGLRGVVCAAAPLPRALHRDLTRRLAAPCRQAYGLTESSCSLLVAPRDAPPDTQGRVVPGAEAKVVPLSGAALEALGPLEVGELMLRAPSIMVGYLHQDVVRDVRDAPSATGPMAAADASGGPDGVDADGWLSTGDLAYYDRNGYVFVVDRLKDVTLYTHGHFKEFEVDANGAE